MMFTRFTENTITKKILQIRDLGSPEHHKNNINDKEETNKGQYCQQQLKTTDNIQITIQKN